MRMNRFNISDRNFSISRNYLVEASAGTGKTFSIQNIAVRLLIEHVYDDVPLALENILIVTFTRAATRELKMRIAKNIEAVHNFLNAWLQSEKIPDNLPDYVLGIIENGREFVLKAKKRLKLALFTFDRAQIFTIHSFCARMLKQYALESDLCLQALGGEDPVPNQELMNVMKDFFRTEIRYDNYSPFQIEKYLSLDRDQKKLLSQMHNHYEIIDLPSFQDHFDRFCEIMLDLKHTFGISGKELMVDFNAQVNFYKNNNAYKENKAETLEKIKFFSTLFDQESPSKDDFDRLLKDDCAWVYALDPSLLKKPLPTSLQLHYPGFYEALRLKLNPIIKAAADPDYIFARLVKDFKAFLANFKGEEEKFSPDDFLLKMQQSLNNESFLKHIQSKYRAVIIDEFQDTDPLQWDIFRKLFAPQDHSWTGYLYLVGDPKQSIYSFRQADIYTYLAAMEALGKEHCYSLDVNYRSHPTLIEALNTLFLPSHSPNLFPLPKKPDAELLYQPVTANEIPSLLKEDDLGAVHFMLADAGSIDGVKMEDLENRIFFPYISQEILRLCKESHFAFNQFAVLVRDRHQAARLATFFESCEIPYSNQKQGDLTDSTVLSSFTDVLRAILYPRDRSAVKAALGSGILGRDYDQIKNFDFESVLLTIHQLRKILTEKGFAVFFHTLLESRWFNEEFSVKDALLNREGGIHFLHDLQQLADLIIEHQYLEWNSPEGIIPFLDRMQDWDDEDKRLKRVQDPSGEGVKILTLHYSKGLEFDVVFTPGLINRRKIQDRLIPIETEKGMHLAPAGMYPEALQHFCEENDAEKMRQLYVALTRAKYRVYIPLIKNFPSGNLKIGEASPLDLFLARFNRPCDDYRMIYERIRSLPESSLIQFIEEKGKYHHISCKGLENCSIIPDRSENLTDKIKQDLIQPEPFKLYHQSLNVTSFSGLSIGNLLEHDKTGHELIPHDFNHPQKTVHTLPSNADTGIFVHSLLEKINFNSFKELQEEEEAVHLVEPFTRHTIYQEWTPAFASMLFQTLKTNLKGKNEFLCLAELKSAEFYREMPFLYPLDHDVKIEELAYAQGLIKGVIDLIFTYDNRYFIVDWKTNWLGPSSEDYASEKIALSIAEHGYGLQAKIYREALKRYLQIVDPRPFEECYGGTFYLYLRGMSIGKQTGIYGMQ